MMTMIMIKIRIITKKFDGEWAENRVERRIEESNSKNSDIDNKANKGKINSDEEKEKKIPLDPAKLKRELNECKKTRDFEKAALCLKNLGVYYFESKSEKDYDLSLAYLEKAQKLLKKIKMKKSKLYEDLKIAIKKLKRDLKIML